MSPPSMLRKTPSISTRQTQAVIVGIDDEAGHCKGYEILA